MSDSLRPSLYDADVRLGHAPHNASQSADATAPLQPNQDQEHFHGSQDRDLDQMYFDSFGTFNNLHISGAQNYSSDQDLSQPQPREDELDRIVAVHHQSLRAHEQAAQDIDDDNVTGFLQVPTAQPWNSVVAAQQPSNTTRNNLQRTQMNRAHQTPTKQQGFVQSDEGYFTTEPPENYQLSQQDLRSVRSVRSNSFDRSIARTQETPRSFPGYQILRPNSHVQTDPDPMDSRQTPNRPGPGSEAETLPGAIRCPEQDCKWSGKTNSDLKKHQARHKLAHKCDVGDCSSAFATVNDLIRHKASVHKFREPGIRVHRCFGVGCKNPEKEWPRKDNFRSHLNKTHPNEKEEELLARDAAWWNSQQQGEINADVDHEHIRRASSTAPRGAAYSPSFQGSMTPQYPPSTSDSGYANTSPFTPTRTAIPPYIPRDASFEFGTPTSGTPQYFQQQQRSQHMQSTAIGGYHGESSVPSVSRSQGVGPGRPQHYGIPATRNQHRYLGPRHNLTAGIPFGHGALGGQQMSHSRSQSYAQDMPSPQILQSGSGYPVPMLAPQRSDANQQRNTVADPTFLEQDRIELGQEWDEQFAQISALQDYPMLGDDLSQVGHAGTELNKASTSLSIPRITVNPSDERPSGDLPEEFNVEHLKKFLASYEHKVTTEQDRALIRSARRTLESTQGAASTDLTLNDGQADDYIEEFADDVGKIAYRCKWHNCKSQKTSWTHRSEIKKHTKRHIRQYGCTFDHCYRRFGSKSDWIRHETKRHSQLECWLCERNNPIPAPGIQRCRKVYLKREQFEVHLDEVHKLSRKTDFRQLNLYITEQHISAGFQPKYWCGFCREILRLPLNSNKGRTAIHARNDHIADHFITEERCIDDWYPPDGMMSKGQRRTKRMGGQSQENDEGDDAGDEGDGDGSPHRPTSEDSSSSDDAPATGQKAPSKSLPSSARPLHGQMNAPQSSSHGLKRTASDAGLQRAQPPAKRLQPNKWTCHSCQWENNIALFEACDHCDHERCQHCWQFYRNERDRMPNPDMSMN